MLVRYPMCLCLVALASRAVAQPSSDPLALELAFSQKQIRRSDAPTVTADGKRLAYEVFAPPERPNPDPKPGEGVRTFVVATGGGVSDAVCADGTNCWRPSWSRDGRQLAFYSDAGGMPQLWVYDVASRRARRVSDKRIKARLWPMDKPVWRPDGSEILAPLDPRAAARPPATPPPSTPSGPRVAAYSTDSPSGKGTAAADIAGLQQYLLDENNAVLAAVDVKSGASRTLVPADAEPRPSLLRLSPDGRWMSYLSVFRLEPAAGMQTFVDLVIVPVAGGPRTVVDTRLETTERIYGGEPYLWTADAQHLLFTKGRRLWIADVGAAGAGKPRLLDERLGPLNDAPFALSADGRAVLVGLAPDGDRVYDAASAPALVMIALDGSGSTPLGVRGWPVMGSPTTLWQPDRPAVHVIVSDETTAERSIVRVEPGRGTERTVWRGRGRINPAGGGPADTLIARVEDVATAPDFFRFSCDFGRRDRVTRVEPGLERVAVGRMETFTTTVPGFDGRPIVVRSAIFLPAGAAKDSRLPTVVYFYSGARFSDYAQDFGGGAPNGVPVQVFATRGYAVLVVDAPMGPIGQGGNPLEEMTDAILPQVRRAADLGYTDLARVALIGHSYGAYGAAGLIAMSRLFRAAVAIDGTYDLAGGYGSMVRGGVTYSSQWFEGGQGRMGTHPWADLQRYLANSPYYLADRIRTPLLLLHGRDDDTCPPQEAEKMFNALKRLDRHAELAIYEGEGHAPSEWTREDAADAARRILAFFARHLTSDAAPEPPRP